MRAFIGAMLLAVSIPLLGSGTAGAQTSPQIPGPPATLCVNNKCATKTLAPPVTTPAPVVGATVKWNPGHYMASESLLGRGDTMAKVQAEMDDINGWDQIVGYRALITWGALEPTQGNYDFSVLDAILNRLKTQYNKPKHLVVVVLPGVFGGVMNPGSPGTLPLYIQTNSIYGPSPVQGSYGWWGTNANGKSTGAYCAALYRPAVLNRLIALTQAMGAHYDGDPYFEALMIQEDSWMIGLWEGAPDYSPNGPVTISSLETLLTASTAAFPHTSVIMENTWAGAISTTMNFETWMVNNRIAPGSADVLGQTAFTNHNYGANLAWGLQALVGISNGNVSATNLRPRARSMMDVESAELVGPYFSQYGGPFTPLDIVNALNQTYGASHAFWTHFFGTETGYGPMPAGAVWKNLAATVSAHPLINTGYPANYPAN